MSTETTSFYFLVTGANSGLGHSIVKRLCTDFLRTHAESETLTVIFTTRSSRKSTTTLSHFIEHLTTLDNRGFSATLRIRFSTAQVDLTDLRSVISLSRHLNRSFPKLDAAIFNAGMGAFTGIDWLSCFGALAVNWVDAVTHPKYKLQAVGRTTIWELPNGEKAGVGEVFCANVFGHYYLAHEVMPLLNAGRGRIIWVSSLEAYPWTYSPADMDGVKATHSYEGSKRLTDVMVLTGASAATRPWSDAFFASEKQDSDSPRRVRSYVCHPGICATSMVDLPAILWYCMTLAFFIARWLGSPWHTISTDSGANAPVHLALATDEELAETNAERVKWGSGSDRSGNGVLRKTEVDEEGGEEWEALGRDTWRQMEELRLLWKGRLEV